MESRDDRPVRGGNCRHPGTRGREKFAKKHAWFSYSQEQGGADTRLKPIDFVVLRSEIDRRVAGGPQ
ncbi:hypothetical protein SAMN05443247_11566 [Bradyrhizobium erythrophlei]|jgi:hypothetical protein|nr:hypothetical protein SAMN05443247_11566 [Bradyrhizobium erythrophlei]